jgi:hypothetical protein
MHRTLLIATAALWWAFMAESFDRPARAGNRRQLLDKVSSAIAALSQRLEE